VRAIFKLLLCAGLLFIAVAAVGIWLQQLRDTFRGDR